LWEILPSHDSSRSPSWFFLLPFSNTLTERDQMHTPRTLMMCCWSGILLKCRFSFCTSGVRPGFCLVNKLLGDALLLVHRPVITLIRVVLSISHFPHTYIAKFYFSSWWILNRLSFLRIIALAPSGFFCLFVCLFLAALGFELRASHLLGRCSHHLSHSPSPALVPSRKFFCLVNCCHSPHHVILSLLILYCLGFSFALLWFFKKLCPLLSMKMSS
jgi:hypothetical protein